MSASYGTRTDLGNGIVLEVVNDALDVDVIVYEYLFTTTGYGQPKELKRIRLSRAQLDSVLTPALAVSVLYGQRNDVGQGLVACRTSADGDIQLSIYEDLYTTTGVGEPKLLREVTLSETVAASMSEAIAMPPFNGHSTLANGLTAYWKFEEAGSVNKIDEIASLAAVPAGGNLGSAAGIIGLAASSAAGDYFSATTGLSELTDDRTVSFWYYTADSTAGPVPFQGISPGGSTWSAGQGIGYSFTAVLNNTIGGQVIASGSLSGGATTWHHVVVYVDVSAKTITLIINNGTPDTTAALTGTIRTGDTSIRLASSDQSIRVDELGLWNRILTAQEITDLYNAGSGLSY